MKTAAFLSPRFWWCLVGAVLLSAGAAWFWRASHRGVARGEAGRASVARAMSGPTSGRDRASAKTARTELARAESPARAPAIRAADSRRARLVREFLASGETERTAAALDLAESLRGVDAVGVLELMQTLPESARELLGLTLIELWRQENPAEAAELVVTLFPAGKQTALLQQVLLNWTMQDWPGAIGFVQELPAGPDRIAALRQVVSVWLRNDPTAAAAAVEKLGEDNQALLGLTASLWVRLDPLAAVDWVQHLPESPGKASTMSALVAAWAQQDPLGAAEHVLSRAPDSGLVISVISGLAAQEPDLATQIALGFPAGRDRDYAIENAYYRWAQRDSKGAFDGASRLGWGDERDKAIYAVAGSVVDSDPASAARYAIEIGDADLRNRQTERAAREWLKRDPLTARHWILTSALSDARKRALLGEGGT